MRNNTPRNSTPKGAPKGARKGAPVTDSAATVAAVAPPPVTGARIEFVFGSAGRPDTATVAAVAAAFDLLTDMVNKATAPRPAVAPRNATPRIRAAYAADNAAVAAAFDLLRTAVANGRARNNGR